MLIIIINYQGLELCQGFLIWWPMCFLLHCLQVCANLDCLVISQQHLIVYDLIHTICLIPKSITPPRQGLFFNNSTPLCVLFLSYHSNLTVITILILINLIQIVTYNVVEHLRNKLVSVFHKWAIMSKLSRKKSGCVLFTSHPMCERCVTMAAAGGGLWAVCVLWTGWYKAMPSVPRL